MLELCSSDDELGIILGHEIAHSLLGHAVHTIKCIFEKFCYFNWILVIFIQGWKRYSGAFIRRNQSVPYRSSLCRVTQRHMGLSRLQPKLWSCKYSFALSLRTIVGDRGGWSRFTSGCQGKEIFLYRWLEIIYYLNRFIKACFDIRAAVAFWAKMHILESMKSEEPIAFLSTHPSHKVRQENITGQLPTAMATRKNCKVLIFYPTFVAYGCTN